MCVCSESSVVNLIWTKKLILLYWCTATVFKLSSSLLILQVKLKRLQLLKQMNLLSLCFVLPQEDSTHISKTTWQINPTNQLPVAQVQAALLKTRTSSSILQLRMLQPNWHNKFWQTQMLRSSRRSSKFQNILVKNRRTLSPLKNSSPGLMNAKSQMTGTTLQHLQISGFASEVKQKNGFLLRSVTRFSNESSLPRLTINSSFTDWPICP